MIVCLGCFLVVLICLLCLLCLLFAVVGCFWAVCFCLVGYLVICCVSLLFVGWPFLVCVACDFGFILAENDCDVIIWCDYLLLLRVVVCCFAICFVLCCCNGY